MNVTDVQRPFPSQPDSFNSFDSSNYASQPTGLRPREHAVPSASAEGKLGKRLLGLLTFRQKCKQSNNQSGRRATTQIPPFPLNGEKRRRLITREERESAVSLPAATFPLNRSYLASEIQHRCGGIKDSELLGKCHITAKPNASAVEN